METNFCTSNTVSYTHLCSYVVDSCYKIFVIAGQQYGAKIKWYEVYGFE